MVARGCGVAMPIGARAGKATAPRLPRWYDSGYPGGMLAFILKKFVGSYLALRAVSRVHCWPVYPERR
jgi:hypothetical protein